MWDVTITGLAEIQAALGATYDHMKKGVERGTYQGALRIMAESQHIVPVGGPPTSPYDVAPGTLRDSGTVLLPVWEGDVCVVVLGYGGAASAYAWRQHEDLTYQHKPGQQAKYLEVPMLLNASNGNRWIADEVAAEMRR